jgi:sigma-B regulation protein RsbU (phosphoserine phosphatase)
MLSVYSPVKDSKGEKIGLLGVDFAMRKIHAELTAYYETVVLGAAVTVFPFAALLIFFVRKNVTGPIRFLAEKASEFASADPNANELSAVKLHMRNKDEIGMLASAFEKMTEDLVRYVSELTVTVAVQGRIESELHVARNIQAGILPATFPAFPQWDEFDLYASMAPVREVGGDLYDFFMMDESHVALIIGDVSGKGVPAALFMMVVRTLIKNEIHFGGAPHEVFERVNRTLCENNNACMFVTAFVCFYDVETGLLKYASAGHNPPVIVKSGGEAKTLESPSSLVLALDETARYSSRETVLEPGDCILLYTDGVTEAFSDKEEMFSEARLIEAVAFPASGKDRAREVIERVADRLRIFTNGAKQSDDIAMLALARRDGADREDRCVEMDEKRTEESLAEKVFPRVEGKDQSARTFRSDVNCLDAVQAFVRGLMEKAGIAGDVMGRVELVVEEVFVNIADYAYKGSGSSGEIAVRCGADPEIVSLEFVDNGPAFNPLERRDPNVNLGVYEREPRGLGIFIVKKVMDVLEYRREDGKNILSMSKNLKKPA